MCFRQASKHKLLLLVCIISLLVIILCTIRQHQENCSQRQIRFWHKVRKFFTGSSGLRPIDEAVSSYGSVCKTLECIALYEKVFNGTRRIPAIRHILWKSDQVSDYFAKQLKTWSTIYPDWKFVLWRDSDIEKFVAKQYTGVLRKFRSLPKKIMQLDMIRYMILHFFGGVYADLDYQLVLPLDKFLNFPAVVTRESEVHAFFNFNVITEPAPVLGNPAFMMSEPLHPFFLYCVFQLASKTAGHYYSFAGPMGLSGMLTQYAEDFPLAENANGVVIVPASRNFYPFEGNRMSGFATWPIEKLRTLCLNVNRFSATKNIIAYCKNLYNLDPISNPKDPVYAIHDNKKSHSSYNMPNSPLFHNNPVNIRSVLPNVVMADTLF